MSNKKLDFTIGADPEFLAFSDKKQVLSASDFGGNSNYSGSGNELGQDGGGTLFECRPNPSTNPHEVVRNIHIVLQKANAKKILDTSSFHAGSNFREFTIGGHIHFGLKSNRIDPVQATKILSNYVGPICVMLENYRDAKKRRQNSYGRFEDCRCQNWGFEYRTPSSWLVCPHISAGMLCLAKTVMFEVMNNGKFEGTKHISPQMIDEVDIPGLREKYQLVWADIKKMELYPMYKSHLDLLDYLVVNKKTWIRDTSMKENWGLYSHKREIKKYAFKEVWKDFLAPTVEIEEVASVPTMTESIVGNTVIVPSRSIIATENTLSPTASYYFTDSSF